MLLPLHQNMLLEAGAAVAALTGTALPSLTEAQVVAGGETIIITLTNDTWVAAGAAFNAIRQDIIDGLDSAQSETTGWNAEVRDKEVVGAVVRTSDTVVTITLTAAPAYDITQESETITVTVPASAVVGGSAITATPTLEVEIAAAARKGRSRKPRRYFVEIDGEFFFAENISGIQAILEQAKELARESAPIDVAKAPPNIRIKPPRIRVKTASGARPTSVTVNREVQKTQNIITGIYRQAAQNIENIREEARILEQARQKEEEETIISLLF